eukprot:TRINITY_DN5338_c0_g1_i1.p1 TRINITY_DN5338_c0_g1~~TRINITY_DN5338_c0_g1_i1.p1  ORF type:complete len:1203 (+),score=244.30 TRINITY_DN5338_c0_g1_i1:104-3712(+)
MEGLPEPKGRPESLQPVCTANGSYGPVRGGRHRGSSSRQFGVASGPYASRGAATIGRGPPSGGHTNNESARGLRLQSRAWSVVAGTAHWLARVTRSILRRPEENGSTCAHMPTPESPLISLCEAETTGDRVENSNESNDIVGGTSEGRVAGRPAERPKDGVCTPLFLPSRVPTESQSAVPQKRVFWEPPDVTKVLPPPGEAFFRKYGSGSGGAHASFETFPWRFADGLLGVAASEERPLPRGVGAFRVGPLDPVVNNLALPLAKTASAALGAERTASEAVVAERPKRRRLLAHPFPVIRAPPMTEVPWAQPPMNFSLSEAIACVPSSPREEKGEGAQKVFAASLATGDNSVIDVAECDKPRKNAVASCSEPLILPESAVGSVGGGNTGKVDSSTKSSGDVRSTGSSGGGGGGFFGFAISAGGDSIGVFGGASGSSSSSSSSISMSSGACASIFRAGTTGGIAGSSGSPFGCDDESGGIFNSRLTSTNDIASSVSSEGATVGGIFGVPSDSKRSGESSANTGGASASVFGSASGKSIFGFASESGSCGTASTIQTKTHEVRGVSGGASEEVLGGVLGFEAKTTAVGSIFGGSAPQAKAPTVGSIFGTASGGIFGNIAPEGALRARGGVLSASSSSSSSSAASDGIFKFSSGSDGGASACVNVGGVSSGGGVGIFGVASGSNTPIGTGVGGVEKSEAKAVEFGGGIFGKAPEVASGGGSAPDVKTSGASGIFGGLAPEAKVSTSGGIFGASTGSIFGGGAPQEKALTTGGIFGRVDAPDAKAPELGGLVEALVPETKASVSGASIFGSVGAGSIFGSQVSGTASKTNAPEVGGIFSKASEQASGGGSATEGKTSTVANIFSGSAPEATTPGLGGISGAASGGIFGASALGPQAPATNNIFAFGAKGPLPGGTSGTLAAEPASASFIFGALPSGAAAQESKTSAFGPGGAGIFGPAVDGSAQSSIFGSASSGTVSTEAPAPRAPVPGRKILRARRTLQPKADGIPNNIFGGGACGGGGDCGGGGATAGGMTSEQKKAILAKSALGGKRQTEDAVPKVAAPVNMFGSEAFGAAPAAIGQDPVAGSNPIFGTVGAVSTPSPFNGVGGGPAAAAPPQGASLFGFGGNSTAAQAASIFGGGGGGGSATQSQMFVFGGGGGASVPQAPPSGFGSAGGGVAQAQASPFGFGGGSAAQTDAGGAPTRKRRML